MVGGVGRMGRKTMRRGAGEKQNGSEVRRGRISKSMSGHLSGDVLEKIETRPIELIILEH